MPDTLYGVASQDQPQTLTPYANTPPPAPPGPVQTPDWPPAQQPVTTLPDTVVTAKRVPPKVAPAPAPPPAPPQMPRQSGPVPYEQWGQPSAETQAINAYAAQLAAIRSPDPPKLTELPFPPNGTIQSPDLISTILQTAGVALAALASRRTADPMATMFSAAGSAMTAYQQGQFEQAAQQREIYKQSMDRALAQNDQELRKYSATIEGNRDSESRLMDEIHAVAMEHQDDVSRATLEQNGVKAWYEMMQMRIQAAETLQKLRASYGVAEAMGVPMEGMDSSLQFLQGIVSGGEGTANPFQIVSQVESSGDPTAEGPSTDSGRARGLFQITDGTWKQFAPAQISTRYPSADLAPPQVQQQVAATIPVARWATSTKASLHAAYGPFDDSTPLGQVGQTASVAAQQPGATQAATGHTPQQAETPLDVAADSYNENGEIPRGIPPEYTSLVLAKAAQKAARVQQATAAIPPNSNRDQALSSLDAMANNGTLDPNIVATVKGLVSGTYPAPSSFALKTPYWRSIVGLVQRVYPNFDAATYGARVKAINDTFTGLDGRNLTSIATAYKHAQAARNTIGQLGGGRLMWAALPSGVMKDQLTPKAVAKYEADIDTFAGEYVKAVEGTAGALADRDAVKRNLSVARPVSVLNSTLNEYIDLLRRRMGELQTRLTGLGAAGSMQDVMKLFQTYTGEDPDQLQELVTDKTTAAATAPPADVKWRFNLETGQLDPVR